MNDFSNVYQTGNPNSGGWRFPYTGRPTSVDALYKPMGIDPEFLKKIAGTKEEPKGLLDQALQAQRLTGLLDGGSYGEWGDGKDPSAPGSISGMGLTEGGNPAMTEPGGFNVGFDPKSGALGFAKGGLLGALSGLTLNQTAPVETIALPGLNGYGFADTNYGSSLNAMGPPDAAQAQALADQLGAALGGYDAFGGAGFGGFGSVDGDSLYGGGGFGADAFGGGGFDGFGSSDGDGLY